MTIRAGARKIARQATIADAGIDETIDPLRETGPARALAWAGNIGDQPQLRIISSALLILGLLAGKHRLARAGARMLLAHELATSAKSFIKHRVDRTRPRSARTNQQRKIKQGKSQAKEESSFPSGHSAGALALARAYSREFPEHQSAALALAGMVAAGQISRSAHYMTDVAAGIVLGTAAEAVSIFAVPSTKPRCAAADAQTP